MQNFTPKFHLTESQFRQGRNQQYLSHLFIHRTDLNMAGKSINGPIMKD